jgi:hypothetical protein
MKKSYLLIMRLVIIVCAALFIVGAGVAALGAFALICAIFDLSYIFAGEEVFALMVVGIGALLTGFAVIGAIAARSKITSVGER